MIKPILFLCSLYGNHKHNKVKESNYQCMQYLTNHQPHHEDDSVVVSSTGSGVVLICSGVFCLGSSDVFWLGSSGVFWFGSSGVFCLGSSGVFWLGSSGVFWLGDSRLITPNATGIF